MALDFGSAILGLGLRRGFRLRRGGILDLWPSSIPRPILAATSLLRSGGTTATSCRPRRGGQVRGRAHMLDVRGVDRHLLVGDAAGLAATFASAWVARAGGPGHALDLHPPLLREDVHDPAALAAVLARTTTLSSFLDVHAGHRYSTSGASDDDLHEPLLAKLPGHRSEDPGAPGVALIVDQHHRVVVELDVGAVRATALLGRADHDGSHHVAFLDPAAGKGVLHRADDDVAERRVAPARPAEHADAQDLLGPRVVRHPAPRLLLDHFGPPPPPPAPGATAWSRTAAWSP